MTNKKTRLTKRQVREQFKKWNCVDFKKHFICDIEIINLGPDDRIPGYTRQVRVTLGDKKTGEPYSPRRSWLIWWQ